jgi:cobalt-zinc-cadmium resistance protein CzcA
VRVLDTSPAILSGATHTARAVLTTGAVAAFGFLPMALATGAGAEVQRPLATVVVCGVLLSTLLTMFILPGVLELVIRGEGRRDAGFGGRRPSDPIRP